MSREKQDEVTEPFKIRCSMLPGWVDCARRAAAKQYRGLVEEHGFKLMKLPPAVGASVGTAVHAAVAALLTAKRDGLAPDMPAALEIAVTEFTEEIRAGCEWDDTTPNTQVAKRQIESLTRAYLPILETVEPILIEKQFKVKLPGDWVLTGKIDLYAEGNHLDDLKTGALPRPYIQQAGGYVLLLESHDRPVESAGTTFVQRVRPNKPQPAPVCHAFPLESARRSAWAAIQEIQHDVGAFAATGDPWSIRANPMSMMCTPKYCPAWGTDFCTVHLEGNNVSENCNQ